MTINSRSISVVVAAFPPFLALGFMAMNVIIRAQRQWEILRDAIHRLSFAVVAANETIKKRKEIENV